MEGMLWQLWLLGLVPNHMCAFVHKFACKGQRRTSLSSCFLVCFLRWDLSLSLKLDWAGWLASELPGFIYFCTSPTPHWVDRESEATFCWVLGTLIQGPLLAEQVLLSTGPCQSPLKRTVVKVIRVSCVKLFVLYFPVGLNCAQEKQAGNHRKKCQGRLRAQLSDWGDRQNETEQRGNWCYNFMEKSTWWEKQIKFNKTTTKKLKQEVAMHAGKYSIWGADSGVQGQPWLQSKFVDKLSYRELISKKEKTK